MVTPHGIRSGNKRHPRAIESSGMALGCPPRYFGFAQIFNPKEKQMGSFIYLSIVLSEKFDKDKYNKFYVDAANERLSDLSGSKIAEIPYPILYFKDIFIEEIVKHGLTKFILPKPISEALATPKTSKNEVVSIIIRYLRNVGIDNELIIIDPYFFAPTTDSQYSSTLMDILSPFFGTLSDLIIVTASHKKAFSKKTKTLIKNELKDAAPKIRIHHTKSNKLHDRFWISNNRQKGIFSGASLNGFGKKYAIVDYLNDSDVAEIVNEFTKRRLIK